MSSPVHCQGNEGELLECWTSLDCGESTSLLCTIHPLAGNRAGSPGSRSHFVSRVISILGRDIRSVDPSCSLSPAVCIARWFLGCGPAGL